MVTLKLWQLAGVFVSGSVFTLVLLAIGIGLGEQRAVGTRPHSGFGQDPDV